MNKTAANQYQADASHMDTVVTKWDDREDMFMSNLKNTGSNKSKIADGGLTTFIIERSGRVMAQLPTGVVKAAGIKDKGKAMLYDLIIQRHIIPNATGQYDLRTKFRMQDQSSMVYGTFFGVVEEVVRDDYIGPDYLLIPARNITPQQGRISIQDSDYCWVDKFISRERLEKELKNKNSVWEKKAIKEALKQPAKNKPDEKTSEIEKLRSRTTEENRIRIVVKYTPKKIYTYFPDCGFELGKEEENPFGEIPIVEKWDIPLLDTIWGLSTMERGMSVQKAKDSLNNLFHEGAKHFVFPPTIVNPNGVVPNTLRWGSGKFWLERVPNSIRRLDSNPQGLGVFQGVMQYLNGIQQNQLGTTTTEINQEGGANPNFGKTPEALKQLKGRESVRDNEDRFQMEQTVEKVYNLFIKYLAKKGKTINIDLLEEEIEQIADTYPDIKDMVKKSGKKTESGRGYRLTVSKEDLQGVDAKYIVDAGSTKRVEEDDQFARASEVLLTFSKIPELEARIAESGKKFDMGELGVEILQKAGLENAGRIIYPMEEAEKNQFEQDKMAEQQAQMQPQMPPQPMPAQMPQGVPSPIQGIQDPALAQLAGQISQAAFGAQGGAATAADFNNLPI